MRNSEKSCVCRSARGAVFSSPNVLLVYLWKLSSTDICGDVDATTGLIWAAGEHLIAHLFSKRGVCESKAVTEEWTGT